MKVITNYQKYKYKSKTNCICMECGKRKGDIELQYYRDVPRIDFEICVECLYKATLMAVGSKK